MVFSSPIFLFGFLPLCLGVYLVTPRCLRNTVLLAASLLFYAWGEKAYALVLVGSVIANYWFGRWVDALHGRTAARWVVAAAVLFNVGLLAAFKYANFAVDTLNPLLTRLHVPPIALGPIHLPLGISFFTFHALSYVIDIYRRDARAMKHPIDYALYISFFPQSIAGPIVRYHDVAPQFTDRRVTLDLFASGAQRFVLGLGKKMLLANTLAGPVDTIFSLPTGSLTPALAWLGVACYTLQIYFDFSGYSDMAIGLARMLGFRFLENFNYPYVARSVTDFWRRWHISLSTWYRDYLYIPLGGNRCAPARVYVNLVTVFLLCGLWHGASWTFTFWGLFHGLFLVIERLGLGRRLAGLPRPIQHAYSLLVVMVGWVFFRARNFAQAVAFLKFMTGLAHRTNHEYYPVLDLNADVVVALLVGVVAATPVLPWAASLLDRIAGSRRVGTASGLALRFGFASLSVGGLGLVLLASAMQLASGTYNPFIYFRF
jgi:alginate O-acetyltransferase complex protein AlgI